MDGLRKRPVGAGVPGDVSRNTSPREYVWLAYSLFFLVEPAFRANTIYWAENLLIYFAFLTVCVFFYRARWQRNKIIFIAVMAAFGMAAVPFNEGGTSFCIFAAAFLPFVVESAVAIGLSISIGAALLLAESLAVHMSWINVVIAMGMIAVVGVSNTFIAQKVRANARLHVAEEEIVRIAAVAERERIARDLHDVLGHTLSVIVLKAELAGRLMDKDPQRAAREIAEVESTARAALAEVRETIGGYRTRGLQAEIDQARHTLNAAGVTLHCDIPAAELAFTATEETVLSLAVREAVTNIVRHASAATCTLIFTTQPDGSRLLLVEDDGSSKQQPREGNGLRGMRERVQALGGQLSIGSGSLCGMALRIEIPSPGMLGATRLPETSQ